LIRFGVTMPKPYSCDLRLRVIGSIETGASRREAVELYGISPSVVVIWARRWNETGSILAKPSRGSVLPLDEHAEFLLDLVTKQPDLTLDEIVAAMSKAGIVGSRTAVWQFYERRGFSLKKTLYAAEQKRAEVARARRRWTREQDMFDPARLVFIDETCTITIWRSAIEGVSAAGCRAHNSWLLCRIGRVVRAFSPQQCRHFFRHAGYVQT
jgi:transposase